MFTVCVFTVFTVFVVCVFIVCVLRPLGASTSSCRISRYLQILQMFTKYYELHNTKLTLDQKLVKLNLILIFFGCLSHLYPSSKITYDTVFMTIQLSVIPHILAIFVG